jgi:hypothetical protein
MYVKCGRCGMNYQPDHGCGIAVLCGKLFVTHCSESDEKIAKKLEQKSYERWEAPPGNCPTCWHNENPKPIVTHKIK